MSQRRTLPLLAPLALVFATAGAGLAQACVPDVRYVDEVSDGASSEAGRDDAGDTGPSGICPTTPPPFANACCGAIACSGDCSAVNCVDCAANCAVDEICCAGKPGKAGCKKPGQACGP